MIRSFAILAAAAALSACGGSSGDPGVGPGTGGGGTGGGTNDGLTVDATPSLTFTPSNLTIAKGQTVTFRFGGTAHNVFFDDTPAGAPSDIPGNNASVSIQRTFANAGSFQYTCHIHPGMQGTIIVQ